MKALRDGSALGAAHVLTLLIGLASTVVWTRWMPVEIFGQFKLVMGVISFAGTFCLLGIGQAALMSAAANADGNLVRLIQAKLLANIGGALVILVAAAYYFWWRPDSFVVVKGLLAAAIIFPLYNSSDLWMSWINGKGRFATLAIGRVITSSLSLCAVLLTVFLDISQVWPAVLLFLALLAMQNLFMLGKALRLRDNPVRDEGVLRLGHHATLAMMFTSVLSLDVVLLEHFHTAAEVALYATALVFPDQIKALFSIIGQLIAPRIFADVQPAELWASFRIRFYWLTAAFVLVGLAGFVLIPILVPLLFSAKYAVAAGYGKWLWLAVSCTGSCTYLGSALIGTRKPVYIYAPYVGYPLCLMALYLAFVDYGASGMVYARSASAIMLAAFYAISFYAHVSTRGDSHAR
jgi:O-antigen/teichoic acid export membrane protein